MLLFGSVSTTIGAVIVTKTLFSVSEYHMTNSMTDSKTNTIGITMLIPLSRFSVVINATAKYIIGIVDNNAHRGINMLKIV